MRIVLTVPEDIMREACKRITAFCKDHIVSRESLKEIVTNIVDVTSNPEVICEANIPHVD